MQLQTFFLLVVVFVIIVGLVFVSPSVKKRRHIRNIKKSIQLRNKFKKWQGNHKDGRIIKYLKNINAYVFEELVLTSIEALGGTIKRNPSYSGDNGSDGQFKYNGKQYAIQAKRYANHITREHVQAFNRLCAKQFYGGLFVHTGRTGEGAWKTRSSKVIFISGSRLVDLVLGRKNLDELLNR